MKKNVLLATAAFGGIILIALLLPETPTEEITSPESEEIVAPILPSEVTSAFPTYPGAAVSRADKSTGDEGKIFYSISLETKDPIIDINEWYREALSHGGWKIKSDRNIGGYQIIQGERGNLFTSMQAANGEAGVVTISQQAQIRP